MRGLALGVIVGIVTAAACRAPRTDAPPAAPCSTATAPAVRMAVTLPAGLDPSAREILSTDAFSDAALLSLDITGRVHPAIVRAWETQDQLTWTFTLRDGLRTQDGEALTAPRVRDLLKVALEPPFYSSVSPDVVGIDAPTPRADRHIG